MPHLRMEGISKRFPGVTALDSVDLEVRPSEVVALIGENGAGKSTLMKILGGIHPADSGRTMINGEQASIRNVRDAAGYGIAFIHQELHLLSNLDIGANIFLGREPTRGPLRFIQRRRIEAVTEAQLRRFGLALPPRTLVGRLSPAQQQMVEIAKATVWNAGLLIMDEPTSCLTSTETDRLLQVVAQLRSQGVSIIYISHRLAEISKIADRVVALRDGHNAGILERAQINHDNMVQLMVGRELQSAPLRPAGKDEKPTLELRGFTTRRYPQSTVSLTVHAGEILGIAGLVGSGRSELARAVFGVDRPLAGEVLVEGRNRIVRSARDAIRAGIVLIPEDRRTEGLVISMSVRENLTLPAVRDYSPYGLIRSKLELRMTEKMRQRFAIKSPSGETPVSALSGGNQQKVVLAKWLALRPKVVWLDEPTRGIDVGAKTEVYREMRELAAKGVAIVMISSEMEEILANSDRVAVMHDGRITGILERADCSEEALMRLAVA